jgi:hypothetical protein
LLTGFCISIYLYSYGPCFGLPSRLRLRPSRARSVEKLIAVAESCRVGRRSRRNGRFGRPFCR